ncbi:MAG: peptidoglycan-binding domain-containing protein [Desulfobacteraceae bacterium]
MIKLPISTFIVVVLLIFSNPIPLFAASKKINFTVIEHDDKANGVESKICIVDFKNNEKVIAATDEDGNFEGNLTCQKGERIKILPVNSRYYPTFLECPIESIAENITVSKVIYISNLEFNALWLEKQGRFGDAALVNNEIFVRVKNFDKEKANTARIKVIELIAQKLKVVDATEFDTQQKKVVASSSLVKALRKYQQASKIEPNGKLDYKTLRSMSKIDIGHFVYNTQEGNNMY